MFSAMLPNFVHKIMLLFAAAALFAAASARNGVSRQHFYYRWASLPDSQLVEKGLSFFGGKPRPDSALVCYSIVANRLQAQKRGKDDEARYISSLYNIGYIHSSFYRDYPKAYSYFTLALQESDRSGDAACRPYIYNSMAGLFLLNDELHRSAGFLGEAMQLFGKGYDAAVANRDWQIMFVIVNNMVQQALKYDRPDLAEARLKHFGSLGIPRNVGMSAYIKHVCDGFQAYKRGDYALSAKCFDLSLGHVGGRYEATAYWRTIALLDKAFVLMRWKRYAEAIGVLEQIEKENASKADKEVMADVFYALRLCYKGKGDARMADKYYVDYLKCRDAMLVGDNLESVNRMRFLDKLEAVNGQVRELSYKRRMQSMALAFAALMAVAAIAFAVVLKRKNRSLMQRNRMLYDSNVRALADDEEKRGIIARYEQRIAEMEASAESGQAQHGKKRYSGSALCTTEKEALLKRIEEAMENTGEICSPDFSLGRLSELVRSNSRYVSQVINEKYGKNFNTLLSEYRVREACRRFNDKERYGSFTVEGISQSTGFKSRSNFAVVFRKTTGLSPSEYLKLSRNKDA